MSKAGERETGAGAEGRAGARWPVVVALFFSGWTLVYANRNVFSAVLREIGSEWGLSRTQLGLLGSLFFLAYTAGQVPAGFLADRFSRKALLLPGFYLQGAAAIASGLARSPGAFLASRIAGGAGQSTYYAPQYALAVQHIPQNKRGFGVAAINSGMAGGVITGLLLGSFLVYRMGLNWRVPFIVVGCLSLVAGLLIQALVPEKPGGGGPGEKPGGGGPGEQARPDQQGGPAAWRSGIKGRDFWLLWLVALTTQYGLYLILTWLPFYLQESRGFSGQLASAASTLMPLAAAPSGMLVGWLSDRAGRRKKLALWLVPLSTAAIGAIGMTRGNALLLVGLFLYGMTGKLVLDPVLVAMVSDRVASHARAGALGVLNLASTISMVSAPALTGYLADVTKSFRASFWVAIVLGVLASVLLAFVREEETATS